MLAAQSGRCWQALGEQAATAGVLIVGGDVNAAGLQVADERSTFADAVEVALGRAIEGATAERQWALVAQLAGELEARRRARADVPTLVRPKSRGHQS